LLVSFQTFKSLKRRTKIAIASDPAVLLNRSPTSQQSVHAYLAELCRKLKQYVVSCVNQSIQNSRTSIIILQAYKI
jgi:hypothetical protein